jgi:zinc/manganese transport system substrate-binding protein
MNKKTIPSILFVFELWTLLNLIICSLCISYTRCRNLLAVLRVQNPNTLSIYMNTSNKLIKVVAFIGIIICSNIAYAAGTKLNVVTSFSILADIVSNIGGDEVVITSLVGANQDIHAYQLKPSTIRTLNQSQLFIINGLGLESGWLKSLAQQYHGVIVVASKGIIPLYAKEDNLLTQDPHAWGNPQNVIKYYIPNVIAALVKLDPQHQSEYRHNAAIYTTKLIKLNEWAARQFNQIPKNNRQLVTTHDAFNYFANAYDIKFMAIQGVSTDSDASAKDMALLEKYIMASPNKVVFLENMNNNKLIEQVARDSHAIIGGRLYSDALSLPNESAGTYLQLITYNTNTIIKSLVK